MDEDDVLEKIKNNEEDILELAVRCGYLRVLDFIVQEKKEIKNKYFYLHALKGEHAEEVFEWIFCNDNRGSYSWSYTRSNYLGLNADGHDVQNLLGLVCKLYNVKLVSIILNFGVVPRRDVAIQVIENASAISANLSELLNSVDIPPKVLKYKVSKINEQLHREDTLKLEILQLLFEAGCPRDVAISNSAASEGNLDLLQNLYYNGFPIDESTTSAAAYKRLDVLVWLRSINCPWSAEICSIARDNPDKSIHDYIHKHNPPCCSRRGRN